MKWLNISFIDVTKLESPKIVNKSLSSFFSNVSKEILIEYVCDDCNFLWHIFTWGNVPCFSYDEARNAFYNLEYDDAIIFFNVYSQNKFPTIENLGILKNVYQKS